MSNLQHITSKIKQDSEVQRDAILAKANEESKKIIDKKIVLAKKDAADIIEKSKIEAVVRKNRILSNAQLKVRNDKLSAKQEVIEKIFITAKEKLNNMSADEFKKFVKSKILTLDIAGDENIIVDSKRKEILDSEFINDLNSNLKSLNKKGELKLSEVEGNFNGGFIIEKNGIEINNTFDSLVNSLREEMEFEIARVMFN